MAQLPPPVHGAAIRNKSLLDSDLLNKEFNLYPLPLKFIDNMKDLGKFSFRKILLMVQYCFRMFGIFFSKKIDLVYFTMSPSGGAFYRDILFITIIKLFGKKALLHFRVKGIKKTSQSAMGRTLIKYAFRDSDIICLSQHHLLDLNGLAQRQPYIVPNGIKVEKTFLHLADEYVATGRRLPKILFLSNLSRKKGIPDLIAALAILKNRGYDFDVSLVGNEWDLSFDDINIMITQAGLSGKIKLEGAKFGKEKFEFISQSDIFVFPTYFELFPGVILEAMQFGKAIVTTFEGSIPEIIENYKDGIMVKQQDPEALANGISYLIDQPARRDEMGTSAKKKFFEQFTLETFERNMQSVFEDACK